MATENETTPRAFFEEHGYYHAKGVFTPAELVALEGDFDGIVRQLKGSGDAINARWIGEDMEEAMDTEVLHTASVQRYSAVWARALFQERFLEVAKSLLGDDVILHHTKLFQKPPERGAPFPIHQDWDYFPSERDTMIAGIIHVSDATDEMGCLRIYPGSHRLGRVEGTGKRRTNPVLKEYPLEDAVPVEAKAGDVVFFHYFTLHGSLPNTSATTRKTVLVQLHAGDDAMEPCGHTYDALVLNGRNLRIRRKAAAMNTHS